MLTSPSLPAPASLQLLSSIKDCLNSDVHGYVKSDATMKHKTSLFAVLSTDHLTANDAVVMVWW